MKKMTKFWRLYLRFFSLFIPEGPLGDRKRGELYEPFLKKVGKNFKVASQAMIYNPNGLEVGDHVYIGFNSYLGQGEIWLDNEVLIGNFVSITASNHLRKENSYRFGGYEAKKICIGKGTWLGANSCILAGVAIGSGCLIAAGSVVTKNFANNVIIGGVPAKIIKDLNYE
jgi:maltose O-acetyltransferase